MTDKELLGFAAKAHENLLYIEDCDAWIHADNNGERGAWWNPLHDDGDALRLSANLLLDIEHQADCVYANGFDPIQNYQLLEWHKNDRTAATRRAIVRAAAQIGRTLHEN